MDTKFNLYDLFGVLIPGGVLCIVIHYFLVVMGWITPLQSGWVQAVILLPVAYSAGTLVHHAARRFIYIRHHSLKLLTPQDSEFDAQFTERLLTKAIEVFNLTPTAKEAADDDFRQRLFQLCYDYVIQTNKGVYVENLNAYYAMCRSMIIVSFVTGLLAGIWIYSSAKSLWWLLPIVVVVAAAVKAFYDGVESNARHFAISVYRSFYIATVCPPPNSPPKGS